LITLSCPSRFLQASVSLERRVCTRIERRAARDVGAGHVEVFTADSSYTHVEDNISYHLYVVEKLDDKPTAPGATPDLSKQPDKDPFARQNGSFKEGQCLVDMGEYAMLNNSKAIFWEHILCVPTSFRPQASDLTGRDLCTIYNILSAFASIGKPIFCFFKYGRLCLGADDALTLPPVADRTQAPASPICTFRQVVPLPVACADLRQFVPFQEGNPPPLDEFAMQQDLGSACFPLRYALVERCLQRDPVCSRRNMCIMVRRS
jgi:hypothetical protein